VGEQRLTEDLHVSVVTILELERGFHLLKQRDLAQAEVIRLWVRNRVLPSFDGRILPVDLAIAQRCATFVTRVRSNIGTPSSRQPRLFME